MARKSSRKLWADKLAGKAVPHATPVPTGGSGKTLFRGLVLGIDPSLRGTGLAVLRFDGNKRPILVHSETVKLRRSLSMPECLGEISRAVASMLERFGIQEVALEETIYVQNFRTAQTLGAARGAAIAAAAIRDIPVCEYPPLRVKQAVVGFGRASKEQVARQVQSLLGAEEVMSSDEADAAAVAFCHAFTSTRELR